MSIGMQKMSQRDPFVNVLNVYEALGELFQLQQVYWSNRSTRYCWYDRYDRNDRYDESYWYDRNDWNDRHDRYDSMTA